MLDNVTKEYTMRPKPNDQLTDTIIYVLGLIAVLVVWMTL